MSSPASTDARILLASASPRRQELLSRAGVALEVQAMDVDEGVHPGELPEAYVKRVARDKADAAVRALETGLAEARGLRPDCPVVAADTIVVVDGRMILGKPATPEEARTMLATLGGRRHEVITATSLRRGQLKAERTVSTQVSFRALENAEADAYVACGEWRGKAGGYAIQGVAAVFVTEIRGSLTNVIGLPLAEVIADLRALGALPSYPPAAFPFLG